MSVCECEHVSKIRQIRRKREKERERERLSTLPLTVAHLVCTSSLR